LTVIKVPSFRITCRDTSDTGLDTGDYSIWSGAVLEDFEFLLNQKSLISLKMGASRSFGSFLNRYHDSLQHVKHLEFYLPVNLLGNYPMELPGLKDFETIDFVNSCVDVHFQQMDVSCLTLETCMFSLSNFDFESLPNLYRINLTDSSADYTACHCNSTGKHLEMLDTLGKTPRWIHVVYPNDYILNDDITRNLDMVKLHRQELEKLFWDVSGIEAQGDDRDSPDSPNTRGDKQVKAMEMWGDKESLCRQDYKLDIFTKINELYIKHLSKLRAKHKEFPFVNDLKDQRIKVIYVPESRSDHYQPDQGGYMRVLCECEDEGDALRLLIDFDDLALQDLVPPCQ
jgi:hypothetical protein